MEDEEGPATWRRPRLGAGEPSPRGPSPASSALHSGPDGRKVVLEQSAQGIRLGPPPGAALAGGWGREEQGAAGDPAWREARDRTGSVANERLENCGA